MPQGLEEFDPTDYWARLNAESVDETPSDQDVLRTLRDWKSNPDVRTTLIKMLLDNEIFAARFEHFSSLDLAPDIEQSADGIRSLASNLHDRILERDGARADEHSAPGFFALWRVLSAKAGTDNAQWLLSEINKALLVSLSFVNALFRNWAYSPGPKVQADLAGVYAQTMHAAMGLFASDPAKLVSVLDPKVPSAVRLFAFPIDPGSLLPGPPPWLGPALLEAAKLRPGLLAYQLANALSDMSIEPGFTKGGRRPPTVTSYRISSEKLQKLFRDTGWQRVALEFLAKQSDSDQPDNPAVLNALREQARRELDRNR